MWLFCNVVLIDWVKFWYGFFDFRKLIFLFVLFGLDVMGMFVFICSI